MLTRTKPTVVAVFRNFSDAEAAAGQLKSQGFSEDEIFISAQGAGAAGAPRHTEIESKETNQHEGGISGWFKSLFSSDDEDDRGYYEDAVKKGNVLLSVETTDQNVDTAVDMLNRHSPIDVHREETGDDSERTSEIRANAGRSERGTPLAEDESEAIPVVEEELRVGKRSVQRGGVRVYSRAIEEPAEETIGLREEHVSVERQAVNRPVSEADLQQGKDQVIEVKEYAEEPVISKQARVVEEVRVSKQSSERKETVKDKVRRTEVEVENLTEEDLAKVKSTTNSR